MKPKLPAERLDRTQLGIGVSACLENAERLVEEARMLEANGRCARAAALAIVALEELSKLPILMELHSSESNGDREQLWRAFRNHTHKLRIDAALAAFREGTPEDYVRALFKPAKVNLASLREAALYVDFVDSAFVQPSKEIGMARCAKLIEHAEHSLAFHRAKIVAGLPSPAELESRNLVTLRRSNETIEDYGDRLKRIGVLNQKAARGEASAVSELRAMLAEALGDENE